jgi:hypothetical protein
MATIPFDLNTAIAAWKAELSPRDEMREYDFAELESHLREGFANLTQLGLSDSEAFLIARRRLGGREVAAELAAAHPNALWVNRGRWILVGILGAHLLNAVTLLGSRFVSTAAAWLSHDVAVVRWAQLATACASLVVCAWVLSVLVRGHLSGRVVPLLRRLQHPLGLALLFLAVLMAEIIIPPIITLLQVKVMDLNQYGRLLMSSQAIDLVVLIMTMIFVVVALYFSQRRVAAQAL